MQNSLFQTCNWAGFEYKSFNDIESKIDSSISPTLEFWLVLKLSSVINLETLTQYIPIFLNYSGFLLQLCYSFMPQRLSFKHMSQIDSLFHQVSQEMVLQIYIRDQKVKKCARCAIVVSLVYKRQPQIVQYYTLSTS